MRHLRGLGLVAALLIASACGTTVPLASRSDSAQAGLSTGGSTTSGQDNASGASTTGGGASGTTGATGGTTGVIGGSTTGGTSSGGTAPGGTATAGTSSGGPSGSTGTVPPAPGGPRIVSPLKVGII